MVRPRLMGIVNVTPDSFSDGGRLTSVEDAVRHGLRLVDEGADWLDVGGESTRPGASAVDARQERERVVPVVEALHAARPDLVISVDTSKASVARAALRAGAGVVNDVCALADPEMLSVVRDAQAWVVLMHMRGRPQVMQHDTGYDDLVGEVLGFLRGRVRLATQGGIPAARILVDPGLGFGKAPLDNATLIAATPRFAALAPVVVGASRKRFIGLLSGVEAADQRVAGSVGAALAAALRGAAMLRVHDVAATRQALDVFWPCVEAA